MRDLRRLLDEAAFSEMSVSDYYADFEANFWKCSEFWKLERGQTFAEPGNASWEAFGRGEWRVALDILDASKSDLKKYHEELNSKGIVARRVRVVELPLTPYLQWELHALTLRDQAGGPIKVLDVSVVLPFEKSGATPEVYTLDENMAYEARYDEHGVLASARKYVDRNLVAACRESIVELYEKSEFIAQFFEREVAGLPDALPGTVVDADYLNRTGRPRPIRS